MSQLLHTRSKKIMIQGYNGATDAGKVVRIDAQQVESGYSRFLKRKGLDKLPSVWRRNRK